MIFLLWGGYSIFVLSYLEAVEISSAESTKNFFQTILFGAPSFQNFTGANAEDNSRDRPFILKGDEPRFYWEKLGQTQ